jgi:hypothetical protein
MRRKRQNRKKTRQRQEIVDTVKLRLVLLISFLGTIVFVLILNIGEKLWPIWLVEHRYPLLGILLIVSIVLIILSPVIIEYSKNPRLPSSGPGKNPYIDP